jgi:hypothetical protein
MTNIGDIGGIAYVPGICGEMKYRTAVVKTGTGPDSTTGEVTVQLTKKQYCCFYFFLLLDASRLQL